LPSNRPNFLFIITDQQRADTLGCYGSGVGATPNIDAIGAAGWRAENFIVATPICMPNRATLMTGRMPSAHGVRHNGIPLKNSAMTFVEALRRAGWRTAHVGKSHLQNMVGKPPHYPLDPAQRKLEDIERWEDGRYDQESWPLWHERADHDVDLPFYGFDTVHLTVEHGDGVEGHYRRWLEAKHPGAASLIGPDHAIPAPDYALTRCHQAWRTRVPAELSSTRYTADKTIECMEGYAKSGAPFFIHCSFADPHHPLAVPGEYWGRYKPEDMQLPRSFHAAHTGLPPSVRWLYQQRDAGTALKSTPALFAANEREAREFIALSYGSMAQIDANVGRMLARLDELGLAENTVVVYTSDHGDYFGDHQLLLKGPIHYQGILRPPFLWRDPQGPAGVSAPALAGTLDIAPTILARAGVTPYYGMQGASMLPLMAGGPWQREAMLVEEEGQRIYLGFEERARMRTLVTARHRVSVYDNANWGELYDLAQDPDELHNLWDVPAATALRAELLHALARSMVQYSDPSPKPTAIA
jgi:arylsulfatase A-like enzyme